MTEGGLQRDDIVAKWNALIIGDVDREATHEWAESQLSRGELSDPMIREGLVWLSGFNWRMEEGNPFGFANPPAVGEYVRSIEDLAELLEDWRQLCALHDADPAGWQQHEYRLRLRLSDGSERSGGALRSSTVYEAGDELNISNSVDGRSREGRGFIWRVAETNDQGELVLEFVAAHPEQPEDWPVPTAVHRDS